MQEIIEVSGLRKRFGSTTALDGMSFTVRPGLVTGLVGPNGAGKSTTMRVILGLDAADEGRALIGGRPYASLRAPLRHVGALLDAGALQPSRTARHHLLWLAHSQGLPARRVDEVLEQVGMRSAARRRAGGFSLGMRQRLGIAAALLGDPPVLILDEPVNGLDPEGIVWMRRLLRSLAGEGRAVLLSSHLMRELEGTADHLVVVGRGRVIADTVRTPEPSAAAAALGRAGAAAQPAEHGTLVVTGLPAERIVAALNAAAVPFSEVATHRATLEQAYLDLTGDAVEYRGAGR
jgi:ABC-2 type transport system ATP-binding protein